MINRAYHAVKDFVFASVPDGCKDDFLDSVNKTNLFRGKITTSAFILVELMQILAACIFYGRRVLNSPQRYYLAMYAVMIVGMAVFFFLFLHLGKKPRENSWRIELTGILLALFMLSWCAGISLLDLQANGQIFVYAVGIICVAVTPLYRPLFLAGVYFCVNTAFAVLLPYFIPSGKQLFGLLVNAVVFIVISWCISIMRFHSSLRAFNGSRIIQQKSAELIQINLALEQANQKLEKLAQTDGLTGIYNRFMFDRTIESEWDRCRRQFAPLSFMMIDIDCFKLYNDTYGHQAGDECLKRVAEQLLRCMKRSSDTVARYGGEEFGIILPNTESDGAAALAEHIREGVMRLAIPHETSPVCGVITVSIGISTAAPGKGRGTASSDGARINDAAASIDELIAGGDRALYLAKEQRNTIVKV